MQSGASPDELHAILSRFHTWAGKQPADGNGHVNGAAAEGIREIPYEEAIRQHRERQAVHTSGRSATHRTKAAPATPQSAVKLTDTSSPNLSERQEDLPLWVANLPVVPETEPVVELKAAPLPDLVSEPTATVAPERAARRSGPVGRHATKPSPAKRPAPAKTPKPETSEQAVLAAFPELPARAFVDIPPAPLTQRSKAQRKAAAPPPRPAKPPAETVQASPAPKRAAAAIASPPPAKPKPPVATARTSPPAFTAKPQARPVVRSAFIGSPLKSSAASPARRSIVKKAAPAHTAKRKSRTPKRPPFRQVLATTIQQPKAALALRNKPAPDRTRRITTRFSPAEERRIGKCAAELGITVSSYLRQCALSAATQKPLPETTAPPAAAGTRKPPARANGQPIPYAAPASSSFGGWLALLRNRFLGPPMRFSEEA
jgi:hypothetical protein